MLTNNVVSFEQPGPVHYPPPMRYPQYPLLSGALTSGTYKSPTCILANHELVFLKLISTLNYKSHYKKAYFMHVQLMYF